jgi:Asp-tRNA(Asn)/Glu-tRNA(Gln) amidotransferase A subunit family amidase
LPASDLVELTATEAAAEIARGAVSAEQYVRACLDRIQSRERDVQAFVHLDPEHALKQARALDAHRASGRPIGPLHGVPVAIKDIFDTADYPTEFGSPTHAGRRPQADCAAVARLRAAGAVIIGKAVTTEFAYFHPGKTRNPHDLSRTPGGSSSGSAAAVAAGMVPLAIGSQTNGSVIRPAAFCGVYGMKPGHGLISRAGALILSRALDHIGPFARTLDDLALILDVLAGFDPADPDTRPYAAPAFRAVAAKEPPAPPTFAFVRTPMWDKADADARRKIEQAAKELGAIDVDLPGDYRAAWEAHRVIMATDMAHNLGDNLDKGEVSDKFRDLVTEGRKTTAVQYLAALRDARRYAEGLSDIFNRADAIVTLSTRGVAPVGSATGDPMFCTFWTLTGMPALNMPVLTGEGGLPLGLQLVGDRGYDERLLRTAQVALGKLGMSGRSAKATPAAC